MVADKILVLAINELTEEVLDSYIDHLPHLSSLRQRSHEFETHTDAPQELIEPWIQWVSFFSGRSQREHGVKFMGQQPNSDALWKVLSDKDSKVGLCSGMNEWQLAGVKGLPCLDLGQMISIARPQKCSPSSILYGRRCSSGNHAMTGEVV